MKTTIALLKTSLIATILYALICCVIYPLIVFGIGQICFNYKANGSLIYDQNKVVIGSQLIAQNFQKPEYFHPRPSAAGKNGYDAGNSSGSNLGPTSQKLIDGIKSNIEKYKKENLVSADRFIPVDAVTASGSGLDPHISLSNALLQVGRVAKARNLSEDAVRTLVNKITEGRTLGIFGEPRVNVFVINLKLDEQSKKS